MKSSRWLIFTLVALAQFMVVLDNAITNVALPTIKQQFNFSDASLQWVVTAYALFFGGFLLLGGRVADLFGRRRTLLAGLITFTFISFLIGISSEPWQLVGLRALQGLSGAFMSPAALSIVLVTFREASKRNVALSFWTLVSTGGAALGLLLGGLLTQYLGWRWNFFINVPIGIVAALLIYRFVPLHEQEEPDKALDVPGAILVTSSLVLLVLAFSQAPVWGWLDSKTIEVLAASLLLMGGFIFNETKARRPLVSFALFKRPNVAGANLIMAPLYGAMLSSFFLLTLYLQTVQHLQPALTGLAFLPFPITLALISWRMPRLVARFGYKPFLIGGPLIIAAGMLWLSGLTVNSDYWLGVLPAFIIVPLGVGLTMMPTIAAATSGVPAHEAGLASGIVNTSQQMGGALGLSIISGVFSSVVAGQIAHVGPLRAGLDGFHSGFLTVIIFMVFALLIATFVIKTVRQQGPSTTAISVE